MITKESLQAAKASVNEAVLKIKQSYSNSPSARKIFFVVEGKDDIPYYATKAESYIPDGWKLSIIPASNRNKVVEAYRSLDWTSFSKKLILFFIDRDLSDYYGEDTPSDSNIYVTTKYAIENELCTVDTFIRALKFYCDLVDIDETDEAAISSFYDSCWQQFVEISEPIMSQILYWKMNGIDAKYANYKIQQTFDITKSGLRLKSQYKTALDILPDFFQQSKVPYAIIDIKPYSDILNSKHTPDEYIRGKYILTFFSKAFTFVARNSSCILPSQRSAKDTLSLGYENVVIKLCGIMKVPKSLHIFFAHMKENLILVNSLVS